MNKIKVLPEGKQFTSDYQPTPKAKSLGWEKRRVKQELKQAILGNILNNGEFANIKEVKKIFTSLFKNAKTPDDKKEALKYYYPYLKLIIPDLKDVKDEDSPLNIKIIKHVPLEDRLKRLRNEREKTKRNVEKRGKK